MKLSEIWKKYLRPTFENAATEYVMLRVAGKNVKVDRVVRDVLRDKAAQILGLKQQMVAMGHIIEDIQNQNAELMIKCQENDKEINRLRGLLKLPVIAEFSAEIPDKPYDIEEY